jgi:hypothetical protein
VRKLGFKQDWKLRARVKMGIMLNSGSFKVLGLMRFRVFAALSL